MSEMEAARLVLEPAYRRALERQVVGALRTTINAHGPIDVAGIGSAAKRVTAQIIAYKRDEAERLEAAKKSKSQSAQQQKGPSVRRGLNGKPLPNSRSWERPR